MSESAVLEKKSSKKIGHDVVDEGPPELHTSTKVEGVRQLVALSELHESPLNPRKIYPEAKMKELAESMRQSGFRNWLPIVARPRTEGGYEIAAGHRRRRAAETAGLTTVPCLIQPMTEVVSKSIAQRRLAAEQNKPLSDYRRRVIDDEDFGARQSRVHERILGRRSCGSHREPLIAVIGRP